MKKMKLSVINFNAMGLFNFDTWQSLLHSRNIIRRLTKIAEKLKEVDPDIIMLQEIHTYSVLKVLRKNLPNHPFIAYKHFFYGPRGGLVIFSKIPIEKISYSNFTERGTFLNRSFIARIIKNGVLVIKLKDLPLYLLNTYLTPNTDHDYTQENRFHKYGESQIRELATIMNTLAKQGNEIIIGGDFNIAKDSVLYRKFLALSHATDIFKKDTLPTQHQEFLSKKQQERVARIDFIFLRNGNLKAIVHETTHIFTDKVALSPGKEVYLSDHIALQAQIAFQF